jgi:hypothetical protein
MMVSVGDSTDVYLFQVLQGGQEFRKIRTLKGQWTFSLDRVPDTLVCPVCCRVGDRANRS